MKKSTKTATVLAFFKTDCPTCQFAFPFLERLHERFAKSGLRVLGVSPRRLLFGD